MNSIPYSFCFNVPRYVDTNWYYSNGNYSHIANPQVTKDEITKPNQSLLIKSDSPPDQSEAKEKNKRKLKSMLDTYAHKFRHKSERTSSYVIIINDVMEQINKVPSSTLASITYHKFYIIIRDLIQNLLFDWHSAFTLNQDDTSLLSNCVHFLNRLVHTVEDVTALTPWLLDSSLIDTISDGMCNIKQLLIKDEEKNNVKQLIRLVETFSTYYQQLPSEFKNDDRLDRLFEATMNCLVSSNYDQIFRKLKPDATSMTIEENFFLIQCPSFIISYQNDFDSQSKQMKEQLLETMVPRYASILDKHIKSINEWNSAMIHAIHRLLLTVIHAKGYYTPYANGQPLQWLIDHIIRIVSENTIINKIDENSLTSETILIDSALKALVEFVHEPDLLAYIKQLKMKSVFLTLVSLPNESIVYHTYILLSYTMSENDIKSSEKESGRLLSNILDSLRKKIKLLSEKSENEENVIGDIALLLEAVQGFVQHDQIKSEIVKQNALLLLINSCEYLNDSSKRLLLESLGSISFDKEAAQLLRENTQFITSVEDMQQTTHGGIQKAAENLIWNVIKEPKYLKKLAEREMQNIHAKSKNIKKEIIKNVKFQYDFMISYCHADKELVYKIHKFLTEQGFKVWFDRDNMYGPAMQAMAAAVENAEFVIMCMSDSYKRSVYCQAEAEYAFHCKRYLLPIIVRQQYRPDGWLGLLLGSRVYIDFARFDFKKACQLLLNEVNLQRKNQLDLHDINEKEGNYDLDPLTPIITKTMELTHLPYEYMNRDTSNATYRTILVNIWSRKDVLDFLFDSNLHLMMPLCELITGYGLIKLLGICQEKPSEFYNQLNDELRSRFNGLNLPLGIFTQFLGEMDRLTGTSAPSGQNNAPPLSRPPPPLLPPPPPPVVVRNIIINPSPPSFPRQLPAPINFLSTSHHTASSILTTTRTPNKVQFIKRTSNRSDSTVRTTPSILPEQIRRYKSILNLLDETDSQLQQINTIPLRRASCVYDIQYPTRTFIR